MTDTNKEREAFEAWASRSVGRVWRANTPEDTDGYQDASTNLCWRAWQARASLSAEAEPAAWGIFDSQGFYEAATDQESAERFCAHYNKRKGADPLKPYTAKSLYLAAPAQAPAPGWVSVPAEPTLDMGWAYLDAARESEPLKQHSFNHAGYRAMIAAAPSSGNGG